MSNKVNKKMIKEMFTKSPQTTLGVKKIIKLNTVKGLAKVEYSAKLNMCHSGNIVQGGFITGWLDAAMALACMCKVGSDVLVLSLEIKTTFIKSINPGPVEVEGKVIKAGNNIAFLEGQIVDKKNNLLAKANQTAKLVKNFYK